MKPSFFVGPALAAGPSRGEREDRDGLPASGSPISLPFTPPP